MEKRRVVITGMGTVNPVGNSVSESWAAVKAGKCGIGPITRYDTAEMKVKLAGGTGLYIDNLAAGRRFAPFQPDSGLREELQSRVRTQGLPVLRETLERVDPDAAGRIHPNDEKRTLRALEVYLSTGKTITQHNRESQALPNRYTPLTIALNFTQRPWLWERIDRRVDEMMARGLEGEVRDLLALL